MNIDEFSDILRSPRGILPEQVQEINSILEEYPYFQAARAVQLKILQAQRNYRYNKALKIAAAHITDRTVLFNFIVTHSLDGQPYEKEAAVKPVKGTPKKPVITRRTENDEWLLPSDKLGRQEKNSEFEIPEWFYEINVNPEEVLAGQFLTSEDFVPKYKKEDLSKKSPEEILGLGSPLEFSKDESRSFSEWLEVSRYQPIDRGEEQKTENPLDEKRKPKFDKIDKFLQTNPKIEPSKDYVPTVNLADKSKGDETKFMTETLAKVYLEQQKYDQAIEAYKILILKNPEKSAFFANQIKAIKILQQNNL